MNLNYVFFTLLLAQLSFAGPNKVRDLYFEIHNDDLKTLIERKTSSKDIGEFSCQVYWTQERMEVVAIAGKLSEPLREILKRTCEKKSLIVIPFAIKEYLKPFERAESKGEWVIYKDATGINSINEIWVKDGFETSSIIEKRPIGTTRVTYHYATVNGTKALEKIVSTSYEGIQNVTTETKLTSQKFKEHTFPVKAEVSSTQNLVRKEMGDYTRDIDETFYFRNISVNESKALLFFSKK